MASAPRTGRSSPERESSPANSWPREAAGLDLLAGGQDAQRDGEVEAPGILGQVGGREIDGDPLVVGKLEASVLDGRAHALASFLDLCFSQSDEREARQAVG
jgi:hypothetical protein